MSRNNHKENHPSGASAAKDTVVDLRVTDTPVLGLTLFQEIGRRLQEPGLDSTFIPEIDSLGGFADISLHPRRPGWLQKNIRELLVSSDRSVSSYTSQEYADYIEAPLQRIRTSKTLKDALPKIETEFEGGKPHPVSGLEYGTARIDMEVVSGVSVENLDTISPTLMREIDEIIVASLALDLRTGVVNKHSAMRIRPDILSVDLQIQSLIYGVTPSNPDKPKMYLIDVYPAYYYDYHNRDFGMASWETAFAELESRGEAGAVLTKSRQMLEIYFEEKQIAQTA